MNTPAEVIRRMQSYQNQNEPIYVSLWQTGDVLAIDDSLSEQEVRDVLSYASRKFQSLNNEELELCVEEIVVERGSES